MDKENEEGYSTSRKVSKLRVKGGRGRGHSRNGGREGIKSFEMKRPDHPAGL